MSEKKYMVFAVHVNCPDKLIQCRVGGHSQGDSLMTEDEAIHRVERFSIQGHYKIFELTERTVQIKKGLV